MPTLKIATYNVNGIRPRLQALLQWLRREGPDIVCLQELKAPDESFPAEDIHDAGYGAIWHGQRSWNGVAVLARGVQPVERRRGLPGDGTDEQSRYLEADVGGLVVGCLYLPNGNPWPGPKFDYKLAWFERLIDHAASLLAGASPVVLAGDFNVVPTDADIYSARSWRKDALLQPESRACYERLLGQGWTDALRAAHPDERIYTFWDYFRDHWARDAGLRIDHVLASPDLAPRLRDAGVDRWVRDQPGPSDHAPTWASFGTEPSPPTARVGAADPAPRAAGGRAKAAKSVKTAKAEPSRSTAPAGAGHDRAAAARGRRRKALATGPIPDSDGPSVKTSARTGAAIRKARAASKPNVPGKAAGVETAAAAKKVSPTGRAGATRKTPAARPATGRVTPPTAPRKSVRAATKKTPATPPKPRRR